MEELYRQLYGKYSPGLSEEELNTKIQFASDQDPEEWVNAFYQKYTGSGPSEEQSNYISNYMNQPKPLSAKEQVDLKDEENESWISKTWGSLFGDKGEVIKSRNNILYDVDARHRDAS